MNVDRKIIYIIIILTLLGVAAVPAPHHKDTVRAVSSVGLDDEVDQCLACHTDKDSLVSTAKAEEQVEIENEGEG